MVGVRFIRAVAKAFACLEALSIGLAPIDAQPKPAAADNTFQLSGNGTSNNDFTRRLTLPDTADAEHISAKTAGVLEVRIPKSEKALPRRIEVQA